MIDDRMKEKSSQGMGDICNQSWVYDEMRGLNDSITVAGILHEQALYETFLVA